VTKTASEPASPKSLVAKLAEVMAAVERVPKRGRNDFHKYDYATEADIVATVRKELSARNVMLIPSVMSEARHPVGDKGSVLTVLEIEMEFLDGDSGQSITKVWRGYGTDKEDKGGYKAMTGAAKYFCLKTFLMPTGDDPENDRDDDRPPAATNGNGHAAPRGLITLKQRDDLRAEAKANQWPRDKYYELLGKHGFKADGDITTDIFPTIFQCVHQGTLTPAPSNLLPDDPPF
jgi:hypothetical protein